MSRWLLATLVCLGCGSPYPRGPKPQAETPGSSACSSPPAGALPAIADLARVGTLVHLRNAGATPRVQHAPKSAKHTIRVRSVRTHQETARGYPVALPDLPADTQTYAFAIMLESSSFASRTLSSTCRVDAGAGEGIAWFTEGLRCEIVLGASGSMASIQLLDQDQQTGDADDDGVIRSESWFHDVRYAAQLLSVPWPAEPVGVGACWSADSLLRVDRVLVRRHVDVRLTAREHLTGTFRDEAAKQALDPFDGTFHEIQDGHVPVAEPAPMPSMFGGPTLLARLQHEGSFELDVAPSSTWVQRGSVKSAIAYTVTQGPSIVHEGTTTREVTIVP